MLMMVFEIIMRENPGNPNFKQEKSLILIPVKLNFEHCSRLPKHQ